MAVRHTLRRLFAYLPKGYEAGLFLPETKGWVMLRKEGQLMQDHNDRTAQPQPKATKMGKMKDPVRNEGVSAVPDLLPKVQVLLLPGRPVLSSTQWHMR